MKFSDFSKSLKSKTEHELYTAARQFLLQEYFGFSHNSRRCRLVFEECKKRGSKAFERASSDAAVAAESFRNLFDNSAGIVNSMRIDFMSKPELNTFLQTAGASERNEILEESAQIEDVFKKMETGSGELFLCRVTGDSMRQARILDGDYLVVDRKASPGSGSIAVVSIAGNILVKRLLVEENRLYLVSENDRYPPFEVHEYDDFTILGAVKMVLLDAQSL